MGEVAGSCEDAARRDNGGEGTVDVRCEAFHERQPSRFAQSRDQLLASIEALLQAGAGAGTVRSDIAAGDVLAGLGGVALTAGDPSQRELAGRLLDLLMDGLRYRP